MIRALLCLAWISLAAAAWAQEAETPEQLAARIDKLIVQLDDDSFAVREKAQADLAAIGEPALAKLKVAVKDTSAERRQRADKILAELQRWGLGLRLIGTIQNPGLAGAVTLTLSPDGQFVYVPGFNADAVNVFHRDPVTGQLEHRQTLTDGAQLGGVVTLRLSEDGKLAVAAAFRSRSVCLFTRDATTGELKLAQARLHEEGGELQLVWPIDATFSSDGKFVYAVDDRAGRVVAFAIEEGPKLKLVQSFQDPAFTGARGIAAHPDGKTLLVNSRTPGTLAVLDRDAATGKLSIRQLLRDEMDGIHGLAGTTGACVSSDGKFVYTIAGRFEGDQAVGVYRVGDDGKLSLAQEFISDQGELKNLAGGNDLVLSPDGKNLYVSGTTSCSLACFQRDPATGKLTYQTTLANEGTGQGADLGANGIDLSPDGRFLYLALENGASISVFSRTQPK